MMPGEVGQTPGGDAAWTSLSPPPLPLTHAQHHLSPPPYAHVYADIARSIHSSIVTRSAATTPTMNTPKKHCRARNKSVKSAAIYHLHTLDSFASRIPP